MIDFAKLRDPAWQAEHRRKRDEEEALQEARDRKMHAAVELCLSASDELSESERSLVRSCRTRLLTYSPVSDKQEKWLMDIASRVRAETVARYVKDAAVEEHPIFVLANWPDAVKLAGEPNAYWAWVRHQVEVSSY